MKISNELILSKLTSIENNMNMRFNEQELELKAILNSIDILSDRIHFIQQLTRNHGQSLSDIRLNK